MSGEVAPILCPRCGQSNPRDALFCMRCGLHLADATASRDVRKIVTAVFCDLVDSTRLAEQHDPEVLRPLLHVYFQEMRSAIEGHGGIVEKFIGDAVVGLMGIPAAHEDDALRAVRAAMEMVERLAVIDAGAAIPLACRIGITTGEVLVPAGDEPIVGDAMNTASRLQASAQPGWIPIGEPTYTLVRDLVVAERVDDLRLKGKAEPVRAWRLLNVTPTPTSVRHHNVPMVGREGELTTLRQIYAAVLTDRSSRLVTILGAAGVGKSRLVEEFLRSRVEASATVLRGRCLPYGEGITYWPIAEIVRQIAGIEEADDADTAMGRLRAFTTALAEGPAVARGLGSLVGLVTGVSSEELLWAIRRALEHLAADRPVVALVEDIHWADPTLLDVIESLATLVHGYAVLILCEARTELLETRPEWGDATKMAQSITLQALGDDDAAQLVRLLWAGHDRSPTTHQRITAAAEGNPLYIQEFAAMLADAVSTPADSPASAALPPTIQALLSARLDRLTPEERAVAEWASVVGRSFDIPALLAVAPTEEAPTVQPAIAALMRRQLVGVDPADRTETQFRFGHQLMRDAAYDRVPKAERARLHERFADYLDQISGDRRIELEEIIGYHLERAFRYREELAAVDDVGRAIARRAAERLGAAGRRGFERSDITAAVNLLERAVALLEADDRERLVLLPDLARALDANGRFDAARACLDEAVDRAQSRGDELTLAYGRALQCLVFEQETTLEERRRVADACFEIFERHNDDRGLALCWRLRGAASWRSGWGVGDDSALGKALLHARRAGAHRDEVLIADGLSSSLTLGPTPVDDGIRRCEEILADAQGDRGIEMAMSHALAHLQARVGSFDIARGLARRCRTIADESGQRALAAHLSEVAWDVETLAGDHPAAERIIAEGAAQFAAMGKPHRMLEAFLALSRTALGRTVDVESLREMAAHEQRATQALLEHAIGTALLHAGRAEEAEASARRSVGYFATTDLVTMEADTTLGLFDVLHARGQDAEASLALDQAERLYRRKGSLVGLAAVAERRRTNRVALPSEPRD